MTKPFDYVNSITKSKNNMMRDTANDDLAEKAYQPRIINTALSYFPDTILHANLMNLNYDLDNRPQYEFLLNSIRPKKRFAKWVKKTDLNQDLEYVMRYYGCNAQKAKDAMLILTEKNMVDIRAAFETGGF